MDRDQLRQAVTTQFFQSLRERGVDVSAIPQPQLQAMVEAFADSMFTVLAALEREGDTYAQTPNADDDLVPEELPAPTDEEVLIWRGRPLLTIGTRYELTNQRLRIFRGILGNVIEEIELVRVRDTRLKQHMGERMLNVGDVTVVSGDASTPEVILHNIRRPLEVRELVRKAVIAEKNRRGFYFREDIGGSNL